MKFIDQPTPVERKSYEELIARLIQNLDKTKIKAIYQVGSVRNPGISDLDLVVVFKNGVSYKKNPREKLTHADRQILTHGLFGGSEDHFLRSFKYSFFHNYKLLWGKDYDRSNILSPDDQSTLKRQIALEYLLKFYCALTVQKWYGVVKLRTFLLEAKAIDFDLDFLSYSQDHPLRQSVNLVIDWRNDWFDIALRPSLADLSAGIESIYIQVEQVLRQEFKKQRLFLAVQSPAKFNLNTQFINSENFSNKCFGLPLSRWFQVDNKRFFNLMHRLNNFRFDFPWTNEGEPSILRERDIFMKTVAIENRNRFDHFIPIVTSLKL